MKRLIVALVLGCAVASAAWFFSKSQARDAELWIFNDLPRAVEVQVGEQTFQIEAKGHRVVDDLERGRFELSSRLPSGEGEGDGAFHQASLELEGPDAVGFYSVLRASPLQIISFDVRDDGSRSYSPEIKRLTRGAAGPLPTTDLRFPSEAELKALRPGRYQSLERAEEGWAQAFAAQFETETAAEIASRAQTLASLPKIPSADRLRALDYVAFASSEIDAARLAWKIAHDFPDEREFRRETYRIANDLLDHEELAARYAELSEPDSQATVARIAALGPRSSAPVLAELATDEMTPELLLFREWRRWLMSSAAGAFNARRARASLECLAPHREEIRRNGSAAELAEMEFRWRMIAGEPKAAIEGLKRDLKGIDPSDASALLVLYAAEKSGTAAASLVLDRDARGSGIKADGDQAELIALNFEIAAATRPAPPARLQALPAGTLKEALELRLAMEASSDSVRDAVALASPLALPLLSAEARAIATGFLAEIGQGESALSLCESFDGRSGRALREVVVESRSDRDPLDYWLMPERAATLYLFRGRQIPESSKNAREAEFDLARRIDPRSSIARRMLTR